MPALCAMLAAPADASGRSATVSRELMTIPLVNPSHVSFGIGVITPRWLYVLAAATPRSYGPPAIADETLEEMDLSTIKAGDVVGIGIHTGNALRGYEVGTAARRAGAVVVYGGIPSTRSPYRATDLSESHPVGAPA